MIRYYFKSQFYSYILISIVCHNRKIIKLTYYYQYQENWEYYFHFVATLSHYISTKHFIESYSLHQIHFINYMTLTLLLDSNNVLLVNIKHGQCGYNTANMWLGFRIIDNVVWIIIVSYQMRAVSTRPSENYVGNIVLA